MISNFPAQREQGREKGRLTISSEKWITHTTLEGFVDTLGDFKKTQADEPIEEADDDSTHLGCELDNLVAH